MKIRDELYGEFEIEDVLAELIESKPVQRLKGIHQGGASFLVNEKWNVTRYEHSVGVMLLIRKLGGTLEEQIAGLLHDVSHTAFSHVVDFVFRNQEEDYHEQIYKRVVMNSEIPAILEKYQHNLEEILFDESRWTLLEQSAPALCADRIDYTLRDMYTYTQVAFDEVAEFLTQLIVVDGKICVRTVEAAEWFVQSYYKEVIDFFMDPLNMYGYDRLAEMLTYALDKEYIHLDDFLLDDWQLLTKLRSLKEQGITTFLEQLRVGVQVIDDAHEYDFYRKTKLRLIDPDVSLDGNVYRASTLSKNIQAMNEEAFQKATRGVYVKVLQ